MSLELLQSTTRITAIPEIVNYGQNGLLVEPGNAESMYQGLKLLAAEDWELLGKLYHNAQCMDVDRFDAHNTVNKIKQLLCNA